MSVSEFHSGSEPQDPSSVVLCGACGGWSQEAPDCMWCGRPLRSSEANRLREILMELHANVERDRRLRMEQSAILVHIDSKVTHKPQPAPTYSSGQGQVLQSPSYSSPVVNRETFTEPARDVNIAKSNAANASEWKPEIVRNILLWLGGILLGLAAIAFAGYSWTHLGPLARAGVLSILVGLFFGGAVILGHRLPVTRDVFASLTVALMLVDWNLYGSSGLQHGMSSALWWGLGLEIASAIGISLGLVGSRAGAVIGVFCQSLAIPLLVHIGPSQSLPSAPRSGGFVLLAIFNLVGARSCRRFVKLKDGEKVLLFMAAFYYFISVVLTLLTGSHFGVENGLVAVAIARLGLVLPPGVALALYSQELDSKDLTNLFFGFTLVPVIPAIMTISHAYVSLPWVFVIGTTLGAFAIVSSKFFTLPRAAPAQVVIGGLFSGIGAVISIFTLLSTLAAFGFWNHPWSGSTELVARSNIGPNGTKLFGNGAVAVTVFAVLAICSALLSLDRRNMRWSLNKAVPLSFSAAFLTISALLLPVVVGATIFETVISSLIFLSICAAFALWLRLQHSKVQLLVGIAVAYCALAFAGEAIAWSGVSLDLEVVCIAVFLTCLGSCVFVTRVLRPLFAVTIAFLFVCESGFISVLAGAKPSLSGFIVVIAASLLFSFAPYWKKLPGSSDVTINLSIGEASRRAFEAACIAGAFGGCIVAATSPRTPYLGASFVVIVIGLYMSSRQLDRPAYPWLSILFAVFASWAWIGAKGVVLVEAYSWPAATVSLTCGLVTRIHESKVKSVYRHSWALFITALIFGALPTFLVGLDEASLPRIIVAFGISLLWFVCASFFVKTNRPVTLMGAGLALIGEAGLVSAKAGLSHELIGVVISVVGSILLLIAPFQGKIIRRADEHEDPNLSRKTLESVGIVGMAVGSLLTLVDPLSFWTGVTLAIAVPVFLTASLTKDRKAYPWLALLAALLSTWAFVAAYGSKVPEAYAWPAALAACGSGLKLRIDRSKTGKPLFNSWAAYSGGLFIALFPTVLEGIKERSMLRLTLAGAFGLAITIGGAWRRIQAPIVMGSTTMLFVGIDATRPELAMIPQWVPLTLAGIILLWLGVTAERRLKQLRLAKKAFSRWT